MKAAPAVILAAALAACGTPQAGSVAQEEAPAIHFRWEFDADDYVRADPIVQGDLIFFGSDDNRVRALAWRTGELAWAFDTHDNVTSTPAVYENLLVVGSWDGNVYALDLQSGKELWAFPTGAPVSGSPAVSDSMIYVGSEYGTLYALTVSGDLAVPATRNRPARSSRGRPRRS